MTGGVTNFVGFVESLSIPAPVAVAYVVTGLELVGGILLIVGLLSRIAGGLLAVHMLATAFIVKASILGMPMIAAEGAGWELDLALFALAAGVLLIGPGRASLDTVIGIDPLGRRAASADRPRKGTDAAQGRWHVPGRGERKPTTQV